jgi:hypothetical protein
LPWTVRKPANVGEWLNFWAQRDMISNAIAAADFNSRVDSVAEPYAARLDKVMTDNQYIWNASVYAAARKDKETLDSFWAWHGSYNNGFKAYFESLRDNMSSDTFAEFLKPAAFAR